MTALMGSALSGVMVMHPRVLVHSFKAPQDWYDLNAVGLRPGEHVDKVISEHLLPICGYILQPAENPSHWHGISVSVGQKTEQKSM